MIWIGTMALKKALKDAQAGIFIVLMGMDTKKNYSNGISYPVTSDNELSRLLYTKLTVGTRKREDDF